MARARVHQRDGFRYSICSQVSRGTEPDIPLFGVTSVAPSAETVCRPFNQNTAHQLTQQLNTVRQLTKQLR